MMNTMEQRGFTLVETLVAITIIALAIVGPLYAVQQALNASRIARDVLIASSLAQEGVEFVRAVRDGNYITNFAAPGTRNWLSGFDGTAAGTASYANCITADCVIDSTQTTISRTITPLYLSSAGIYNQQGSGTATKYTRRVRFTAVPGSTTEMVVTVTVTWNQLGQTQTVTVTDRLHNWL